MYKMDRYPVQVDPIVSEAVHRGFLRPPVELIAPIVDDHAQVFAGHAERPVVVAEVISEPRSPKTIVEIVEDVLSDADLESLGHRIGHDSPEPSPAMA